MIVEYTLPKDVTFNPNLEGLTLSEQASAIIHTSHVEGQVLTPGQHDVTPTRRSLLTILTSRTLRWSINCNNNNGGELIETPAPIVSLRGGMIIPPITIPLEPGIFYVIGDVGINFPRPYGRGFN